MSASPTIGVLALQGDVREHERSLEAVGATALRVRRIEQLSLIDALVIPGGESTTMSKLAVMDGFMAPLRQARLDGMPMYGSCAGMIMLADRVLDARPDQETIGGLDITVRRNAFGRQVDSFETDIDMAWLGGPPMHAVFIRAPWVEATGAEVEVLGVIDSGDRAGTIVAVRQGLLLATSFHPELTGDHRIHSNFVEIVKGNR
ncbi:MAG: pyridoxal 5'-phosphate synthase glutaminase subunit PdxT [Actinobacteria bacterium]|uniref:glutaminase n=1 Tax=freshwater metagenome TaxID=449393 RepID=A0A6J7CVN9_9ZZZZ|nr:pyridoxal 5'-phosphate synthase glutaminase subunit PdxT [Actinomycetota bacterium]